MPLIGYARASTEDQTLAAQLDALRAAGCGEVFEEFASGDSRSRPQLAAALARVGRGDTLMVARIDRLARSLSHLLSVVEALRAQGAHFRSLADPIDTSGPSGVLVLQMLGAVAEFERSLIRERTKAEACKLPRRADGWVAIRACERAIRPCCASLPPHAGHLLTGSTVATGSGPVAVAGAQIAPGQAMA